MNMLSYSVLFVINETLCRVEAFSGILTNSPKQKLATIKLDNLARSCSKFENFDQFFQK